MKHNVIVTLIIIGLFLGAQVMGLVILNKYDGKELPFNLQRPEFKEKASSVSLLISVLIITALAFLLIKFQARKLWMVWFFLSVFFTLMIAFSVFFNEYVALGLAFVLALLKTVKNNVYLHNFTELFIYGGLVAVFAPVLSVSTVFILLILISIYDMIAVWKTKHMVKLAKFQTKMKVFAGLLVPYGKKMAILGGGDIGFTLLFAGVVLLSTGWIDALIIVLSVSIALGLLLFLSKKDRFYPAMPYLTVGCFIGYFIGLLV
ncbi:hypothetical protein CL618_01845 [archaeon]|nr:hypothetical protein [archaeon]|tara:strand:+ start:845 stop:1627 length:783 start_codon:yes stop_codon:yes gene_type:complete